MSNHNRLQGHVSLARYQKVFNVLSNDRLLSTKIGTATVSVWGPDRTAVSFPAEVVFLTDTLHGRGMGSQAMQKGEIIEQGHQYLVHGSMPPLAVWYTHTEPPAARVTSTAIKPMPKATTTKPASPKIAPSTPSAAKPVESPAPLKNPVLSKPVKLSPKPDNQPVDLCAAAVLPVVEAAADASAPVSNPAVGGYIRPNIPNVVGVVIMNLLSGIATVLEPHVAAGDKDAAEIQRRTIELTDHVYRRTALPGVEKEAASDKKAAV